MSEESAFEDLRDLYQDLILDHGRNPRNFRVIEGATHQALGHNPLCGDRLTLFLTVDGNGIIRDTGFQGAGCAISVASASIMTGMLIGKTLAQADSLFHILHSACTGQGDDAMPVSGVRDDDIDRLKALAGVKNYPMRVKCATLAWHTMQAAFKKDTKASTE